MKHATQIKERLWIGSHQAFEEIIESNPDKITACLNVAMDYIPQLPLHPANVKLCHISLGDGIDNPELQVNLAVLMAYKYYTAGENLLIHCISGVSRSPHIAAKMLEIDGYLYGKHYDDFYAEIKRLRPQTRVPSFMDIRAHQVGV